MITSPNLDASATRLVKLLSLQARDSDNALAAAGTGDEPTTRKWVDKIRVLRSKLQDVPHDAHQQLEGLSPKAKAEIQSDLSHIQRADSFIPAWCQRYAQITSYEELCKTPDGRNAHIDHVLPMAWDFEKDIVVLASAQQLGFAQELIERGQKRIIAINIDLPLGSTLPLGVELKNSKEDLRHYLLHIKRPFPVRITALHPDIVQDGKNPVSWDDIKQVFTLFLTNQKTSRTFGDRWLTQGIINLPEIAASSHLTALGSSLKGLPFIIIAPGPSLDRNIHLLKQVKGRAVLMAAAQCARALSKAGIVPDFIVVIDPGDLAYFLDDVDTSAVDALLVGVSCHPDFYKRKFKSKIVFNANVTADRWISDLFEESIPLSSAGSVSVASMHIARYLECGPIILVGQDLALSEGKQYSSFSANSQMVSAIDAQGKTISFSNISENQEKIFEATGTSSRDTIEPVLTLPGYYGGIVQTRANYHIFHGEFVNLASQENKTEHPRPLLNCTEGGASIEGFLHIPLAQAIEDYVHKEDQNISESIARATAQERHPERNKLITKKLASMKTDLEDAIRIANKCQAITRRSKRAAQGSSELDTLEKKLIQKMNRLPAMALPNQDEIQQALAMSADASTIKENYGAANILYESIIATGAEILPLVKQSLDRCKMTS